MITDCNGFEKGEHVKDIKQYVIWVIVAVAVIGTGFFVYRKMHADQIVTQPAQKMFEYPSH